MISVQRKERAGDPLGSVLGLTRTPWCLLDATKNLWVSLETVLFFCGTLCTFGLGGTSMRIQSASPISQVFCTVSITVYFLNVPLHYWPGLHPHQPFWKTLEDLSIFISNTVAYICTLSRYYPSPSPLVTRPLLHSVSPRPNLHFSSPSSVRYAPWKWEGSLKCTQTVSFKDTDSIKITSISKICVFDSRAKTDITKGRV